MKGIKLLLAVLLAPLAFQAVADDASDIARAATRRNSTPTTVTPSRQKSTTTSQTPAHTASRTINTETTGNALRSRTTTTKPTIITRPDTGSATQSVSSRPAQNIQSRTAKTTDKDATQSRTATTSKKSAPRPTIQPTRSVISGRTATNNLRTTKARNATTKPSASEMMTRDFSKCRTVFYDCMDEFCANKDAQLKRCACSSRINEFNSTKRSLANVEDKLLDFSQRLLTVSMDKEDAAVLNQATEGEIAYSNADTSKSKKMLDEIAKKLNTSFNDSNFDQGLNAISLSLNIDSAFDTVDSLAGASTTTKSGTDLYTAALPVCRQMALEVCSSEDLKIAEGGYQMVIEQDCNTVKKSYQTQVDQARTKVFESSALLDMSRLDIHQKRNSDDILTCKQKMLDMLTDTTVCGKNLTNCLDTTGRYIDPTTGEAFLTIDLAGLGSLIHRPESNSTWTTMPGNERFVSYLNSKKKYLEPAMENCQDISDYVWDAFLEDALAQIKLAQESKLEQVRQSCTTLTTQCMDEAFDSLADFDARALSIFGIAADKTVNAMCSQVRTACTSLLDSTGGGEDWSSGITEIATEKTYESILKTCREVGRACIIQACTSISGNFGLCENISTSINRKSIINRTACWPEVLECVKSAGSESIAKIQSQHKLTYVEASTEQTNVATEISEPAKDQPSYLNFYPEMYGITTQNNIWLPSSFDSNKNNANCITGQEANCVHDICANQCANQCTGKTCDIVNFDCYSCRLAERIWGNCEAEPTTDITEKDAHNRIKTPLINSKEDPNGTLLSWFAQNTGTANAADSCRDTTCGPGYKQDEDGSCKDINGFSSDGEYCIGSNKGKFYTIGGETNCCTTVITESFGNCCTNQAKRVGTNKTNSWWSSIINDTATEAPLAGKVLCTYNDKTPYVIAKYETKNDATTDQETIYIICLSNNGMNQECNANENNPKNFPCGTNIECDGEVIAVKTTKDGTYYYDPIDPTGENCAAAKSYYTSPTIGTCEYNGSEWPGSDNRTSPINTKVEIKSCNTNNQ